MILFGADQLRRGDATVGGEERREGIDTYFNGLLSDVAVGPGHAIGARAHSAPSLRGVRVRIITGTQEIYYDSFLGNTLKIYI